MTDEHIRPPSGYTPEEWFADWAAFHKAKLDTAEAQRDWIFVHFAGKYSAAEWKGRGERFLTALKWVYLNQNEVCQAALWTPGQPMPFLLRQVLYFLFGSGALDEAPPATKEEIPVIFDRIREENKNRGI